MIFISKYILVVLILFSLPCIATAQVLSDSTKSDSTAKVYISSINISGNKKTKDYIILREMPFKTGDSLLQKNLPKIFEQARYQVYNANVFAEVKIDSVKLDDASLKVNIAVIERWYIFPTPQFQLADRSFNEWIKLYDANLNRVIYGLKFVHYNFSGRRDQLKFSVLNGYARNFSASYSAPFSNSSLTEGFGASIGFTQNREIPFKTSEFNRILFYRKPGFVRNSFGAGVAYTVRKGYFKTTAITVSVNYINVDDSVLNPKFNTNYFNNGKRYQTFPDFSIGITYANTNNNNYPQKGTIYRYGISKRGLGITGGLNSFNIQGSFSKFITHKNNFFSSIQGSAIIKAPFKDQAYINQRAIGYGSLTLRGLEVYVVDGFAASVAKYTLSKKILSFNVPVPFRIKQVPVIPFKFFAKTYADMGYSASTKEFNTRLNNKFLYSGGFGLDILTLYDIVIKLEYSFNQLGEKGLFLHGNGGF